MKLYKGFFILIALFMCSYLIAQDFTYTQTGCSPDTVRFRITVDTTSITSASWDFGNGDTSNLFQPPPIIYEDYGTYTVILVIDNNAGTTSTDSIRVFERLSASFSIENINGLTYSFTPTDTIDDPSTDFNFAWEIFDETDSRINNRTFINIAQSDFSDAVYQYTFSEPGNYRVHLRTQSRAGCIDTLSQNITVNETPVFSITNVFSPNTVGGEYLIIDPEDPTVILSFQVLARTGVPVFKSTAPIIYWDGRTNNGLELGTGVYFYIIKAIQGDDTGFYNTHGFIHLFR